MKIKSNKSAKKRFKITGTKKFIRRSSKQNHFNVKEKGEKTRNKRKTRQVARADQKKVKELFPYL